MAENQPKKSKRELVLERLKASYPDRVYDNDEALFGQIEEDYAANANEIGRYKEREDKMTEMLQRDPRSAQFIADMANGEDPWIAVIKRLGIDGVTELMNDPSKQEAYEAANKEYAARLVKEKELEAEYSNNLAESQRLREQMDTQYGEEVVDAALGVIDQICKDAIMGKVTPETFAMALKVVKHDADIENARSEGVVAGRNARIEEGLRKLQGGDGMPAMGGSNTVSAAPKRNMNIFDYAEAAK